MKTLTRAFTHCTHYLFWICLGSMLLVALRTARPSPDAYFACLGAVLVGVASCLLDAGGDAGERRV